MTAILIYTSGCTSKGVYNEIQRHRESDCRKYYGSQYDDCMEGYGMSYESYKRILDQQTISE